MNISGLLGFNKKVDRAYEILCQPLCHEFRISKTALDILLFLYNNPELYTARDISVFRNIKPNVVSLHVDKLVSQGYLLRQPVNGDRRKIRLVCTEKAAPVTQKGRAMQRQFFMQLMNGLSEEELEIFKRCFQVIADNADTLEMQLKNNKLEENIC